MALQLWKMQCWAVAALAANAVGPDPEQKYYFWYK